MITIVMDDFEFSTRQENRKLKMGKCICEEGALSGLVIDGECVICLEERFPLLKECYGMQR